MLQWYDTLRYHVVPPIFLIFFTGVVQFLALIGQDEEHFTWQLAISKTYGNAFSWSVVGILSLWAMLSLWMPYRTILGPSTLFGYQPKYKDNGVLYYWMSLVVFFALQAMWPDLSTTIFLNIPEILGTLNVIAISLCTLLLIKGKLLPEHKGDVQEPRPLIFEFYRGMELHPRLLGVDLKQLTNCRIGMMAWQILLLAFYLAGVQRHGFSMATLVNLLLQSVFIAKFFWWEAGYFNTLDIILDRAGYYICWGCLVWVPCFYTYSSYYLVAHPPIISTATSCIIGLFGIACILLNYRVDYEKQYFRDAQNGKCILWGKPAKFILAEYKNASGKACKSRLLISGFWGLARHLNYTFEILASLAWCLPGFGLGIWPFLYAIFLTGLLVHRTFRDEEKCAIKYGKYWDEYCGKVKYRLIPFVF